MGLLKRQLTCILFPASAIPWVLCCVCVFFLRAVVTLLVSSRAPRRGTR